MISQSRVTSNLRASRGGYRGEANWPRGGSAPRRLSPAQESETPGMEEGGGQQTAGQPEGLVRRWTSGFLTPGSLCRIPFVHHRERQKERSLGKIVPEEIDCHTKPEAHVEYAHE